MGGTVRETQVLEDPASNGLGTEVPEKFLGETTATKLTGPLTPEEIRNAKKRWIKKVQSSTSPNLRTPGWELVKDDTSILRCSGRISGYNPIYIEGGLFG